MKYETTWKSHTAGKTTSAGHHHAPFRQNIPCRFTNIESFLELGGALVSGLSKERQERNPPPSQMGATFLFSSSSEGTAKEKTSPRSCGSRIFHRLVDTTTYRTNDSIRLWNPVYAGRGMENVAPRFWMELSKTGTASLATKRKGNCILEVQNMATYKKKPMHLRHILSLSMKVGSCSYPMFVKRGLRQDARRSFDIATSMIRFRSSEVLRYRLTVNASVCMSDFMPITSTVQMLSLFCGICCATCASMWFWFWITVLSINGVTLKNSFENLGDFVFIGCRAMHQN